MGQRGVGTLLELGPKRVLGTYYLDVLYALYTFETFWIRKQKIFMRAAYILLPIAANVLVRSEYDTIGTTEYTSI